MSTATCDGGMSTRPVAPERQSSKPARPRAPTTSPARAWRRRDRMGGPVSLGGGAGMGPVAPCNRARAAGERPLRRRYRAVTRRRGALGAFGGIPRKAARPPSLLRRAGARASAALRADPSTDPMRHHALLLPSALLLASPLLA